MRRLLTATALSGALLLGACSSESPSAAPPAGGVVPAPAPGGASPGGPPSGGASSGGSSSGAAASGGAAAAGGALGNDTRAFCDQASRVGAEAGRTFATDLRLLTDAETAEDAAVAAKAREKTTRDVQNYASALLDMAGLANDARLKEALSQMAKQVSAIEGDVRKMDADKLAGLQAGLTAVCGSD